jgi:Fe-S-cluster-containing hydrogenase component 2
MAFPSARPCEKYPAVAAIQAESIFVTAESDACIGCGTCVDSCQHPALQMVSHMVANDFHRPPEYGAIAQRQMGRRE